MKTMVNEMATTKKATESVNPGKEIVREIFEEPDGLCSDTGIGFGLDLEDSLSNHARGSEKFRKRLRLLKKKMEIE